MPAGARGVFAASNCDCSVFVLGLGSTFAPLPVTVPSVMRLGVDCSMGVCPGSPDGLFPTRRL